MNTVASSAPSVGRRAASAGARLLGRVDLLHAALVGVARLTGATSASLYQGGISHGLSSEPWLSDAARRASVDGEMRLTVESTAVAATPVSGVGGLAVAADELADRQVALLGSVASQLGELLLGWRGGPFWADDIADLEYGGWGDSFDVGLARVSPAGRVIAANEAARERIRLVDVPALDAGAVSVRLRGENPLTILTAMGAGGRLLVIWDVAHAAPVRALEAQIVSNAAHELRNALTALLAHSEVLPDLIDAEPGGIATRFLGVIEAESRRMGGLLDGLRDALRPDLGSTLVHSP